MSSSKNYASSLSSSHNFGRRSSDDDTGLNDWIEQRQKSFRDFEQSFFNHQQPQFKPLPPLRPIFSRPFSQGSIGDSNNQYDYDDGNDNFLRFRFDDYHSFILEFTHSSTTVYIEYTSAHCQSMGKMLNDNKI
jgi:hypothetical protein